MSTTVCVKCETFFGNPATNQMCSKCYKEFQSLNSLQSEVHQLKIEKPPAPKQSDHGRCFLCSKKVGLLGIKCKECECSYCNLHRLPEDHNCSVDFHEVGKKQVEKANPNISAPKIEQI